MAELLRLLTTCELIAHSEFYANHPQFSEMANDGTYSIRNFIPIILNNDYASAVYKGKIDNVPQDIKLLAEEISKPHVFATPFNVIAMASVIGKPIYSDYPSFKSSIRVRNLIHRKFFPREKYQLRDFQMPPTIHILWTTASHCDPSRWVPNHFVPLVKGTSVSKQQLHLSYADATRPNKPTSLPSTSPSPCSQIPSASNSSNLASSASTCNPNSTTTFAEIPSRQSKSSSPPPSPAGHLSPSWSPTCSQPPLLSWKGSQPPPLSRKGSRYTYVSPTVSQPPPLSPTGSQPPLSPTCSQPPLSSGNHSNPFSQSSSASSSQSSNISNTKFQSAPLPVYKPSLKRKKRKAETKNTAKNAKLGPSSIATFFTSKRKQSSLSCIPKSVPSTPKMNFEDVIPLKGPGLDWFKARGVALMSNFNRSLLNEEKVYSDGELKGMVSKVSGTLQVNIDDIINQLNQGVSQKQQVHLMAVLSVAEYILQDGPVVPTQILANVYRENKGTDSNKKPPYRSATFFHTISRHLNAMQIYLHGRAFILENRGAEVEKVIESLDGLKRPSQEVIKTRVGEAIGDVYSTALKYLDSKQDRDTVTALLAKIVSIKGVIGLSKVQDGRAIRRSTGTVFSNLDKFRNLEKDIEKEIQDNVTEKKKCRKVNRERKTIEV